MSLSASVRFKPFSPMGGASDRFDECQAFTEWIQPLEHAGIFGVLWGPDPNFLTGSLGERSLIRGYSRC